MYIFKNLDQVSFLFIQPHVQTPQPLTSPLISGCPFGTIPVDGRQVSFTVSCRPVPYRVVFYANLSF